MFHMCARWKTLLKGYFETFEKKVPVIVTESSRLDVFRRGGDSLMGRHLLGRTHPWSVAECFYTNIPEAPVRPSHKIRDEDWNTWCRHGEFPEPFQNRDARFTRRWRSPRRDDRREGTRVQGLGAMVQAVVDLPFVEADCFAETAPTIVPARTPFSQLVSNR